MEPNVAVAGWPDQAETFLSYINSYRAKDMFCDCTLACDRKFFRAHKMVLSMCSEFFESIFSTAQDKNPVIILNEVEAWQLECLLNYMYKGETSVPDALFNSLCRVAKCLQIKGFEMVEIHRKAVKMSKHRETPSHSLERLNDNCSSKYLPSKYSPSNSLDYMSTSHKGSSSYKPFSRSRCYSGDFEDTRDAATLQRDRVTPLMSLLRVSSSHSREDYHSHQEGDSSSELGTDSYRECTQPRMPRKYFRSHSGCQQELNCGQSNSKWSNSNSDFPIRSLSPACSENMKEIFNRQSMDRPSSYHPTFCYKEEGGIPADSYSSTERNSSSLSPSREKDNKENETPSRSSPPGLLPSRPVKSHHSIETPATSRSSPSRISASETKKAESPFSQTISHPRGPPPLLKLLNTEIEEDEPHMDERAIKQERTFDVDQSSSPSLPIVKNHPSFLKPVPYLEPTFHRRSESPKNTLQITSIPSKSLEYIKSKSASPQNTCESPLNLSSEEKSKSVGYPSPSQEPDDPLLRKIQTNKRKRVRGPKSWEFLLRLLRDPLSNPTLIKWEDESNGVFRLIRPEIIAQRWGRRTGKHGNDILSYESFARGLRYHYATGALNAVSEKSFVYQFGPKAQKSLLGIDKIPDKDDQTLEMTQI